jgi:type III secretion protein F
MSSISMSTGVTLNSISQTIGSSLQSQETSFNQLLSQIQSKGSDNISQADMLQLQQGLSKLNLFVDLQSTIIKSISDSLKGVIQKST